MNIQAQRQAVESLLADPRFIRSRFPTERPSRHFNVVGGRQKYTDSEIQLIYCIIDAIRKNYGTSYTAYGFLTDKDSTFFSVKSVLIVEAKLYQKTSTVLFASKNSKYIEEKDVPKDVLKVINEGVSRLFKDIEKIFVDSEKKYNKSLEF
jgi:hypothetical protein